MLHPRVLVHFLSAGRAWRRSVAVVDSIAIKNAMHVVAFIGGEGRRERGAKRVQAHILR